MSFLKSFSLIALLALAVGSIFGATKGLSTLCLGLGAGELIRAKEYYDNKQKKWAAAHLIVGLFVCICGILSFINII